MKSVKFAISIAVFFFIFIGTASAVTSFSADGSVNIIENTTDDLYLAGGDVNVIGNVEGDIVAAGGKITIDGDVYGDVILTGGTVIINGNVQDDVRVAAGNVLIAGDVGDDVVAATGNFFLASPATVKGDIFLSSGNAYLYGNVGGSVSGNAEKLLLGGNINGTLEIEANDLEVLPEATVTGETDIQTLEATARSTEDRGVSAFSAGLWLFRLVMLLLTAIFFVGILPEKIQSMITDLPEKTLRKAGVGILVLIATIFGSLFLLITVIGIPLASVILLILALILYSARIVVGIWLGELIMKKVRPESGAYATTIAGVTTLFILSSLPIVGGWIYWISTFISIGAIYYITRDIWINRKQKVTPEDEEPEH